ncbi:MULTISPECIES: hypothetical protein [unclassified Nostoc]|uniref:hypothetical protein n=1 Tax=unclassified Nostoc TaxID=2593658 RepID=UPI0025AAF9B8|nr:MULTISPECIES: hypothetical protein [unclassified Nostoc]MDM9581279.1 hypothetical protein [Nostoc sp. GT001]MDZ7948891.1 hypothetical protein [Nostoc sp. EfeVER01]MDZ7992403.1 hypothetical protein [Nostoc sp. EspVER01]
MNLSKLSKILGLTTAFAISSQATLLIQQNKALADIDLSILTSLTSVLYTGEYLFAATNQYLISPNGVYKAIQQSDGNFVLYAYNTRLWASNVIDTSVYYTIMQTDCNLVSYNYSRNPVWASNTGGLGSNCRLEVQNDGNLVIYRGDNIPVWATNTNR